LTADTAVALPASAARAIEAIDVTRGELGDDRYRRARDDARDDTPTVAGSAPIFQPTGLEVGARDADLEGGDAIGPSQPVRGVEVLLDR
jgi:hypothetical protein